MTGEPLYQDDRQKVSLVERNLVLQFNEVVRLAAESGDALHLTPRIIKDFHRLVMQDIYSCAGRFRLHRVKIDGSPHKPPGPEFVEGLVQGMCDRANESADWDAVKTPHSSCGS